MKRARGRLSYRWSPPQPAAHVRCNCFNRGAWPPRARAGPRRTVPPAVIAAACCCESTAAAAVRQRGGRALLRARGDSTASPASMWYVGARLPRACACSGWRRHHHQPMRSHSRVLEVPASPRRVSLRSQRLLGQLDTVAAICGWRAASWRFRGCAPLAPTSARRIRLLSGLRLYDSAASPGMLGFDCCVCWRARSRPPCRSVMSTF